MRVQQGKSWIALNSADETFRAGEDSWLKLQGVMSVFLLRYASDLWHNTLERLKDQFGNDDAWIQHKMKRARFFVPAGKGIESLTNDDARSSISAATDAMLQGMARENPENMRDVFNNLFFDSDVFGKVRERDQKLKKLLIDLSTKGFNTSTSLGGSDVGHAALALIEKFFETSVSHGGNFMPLAVSELVAKLLDPQPGMRICDPFLGTGSLLVTMARHVKDRDGKPSRNFALYGQDVSRDAWVTAKLNMFLNDLDDARVAFGDTLKKPAHLENDRLMLFERVGSCLPFTATSLTSEEARRDVFQRFSCGFPAKGKSDWAYMLHIISTLAPGGIGAVVVPHGALFRGRQEKKIRERLVAKNLIDAVIALPPRLFFGRTTPMTILIFKKNRKTKNILFVDASREFLAGKMQNSLRTQDIERILTCYHAREALSQFAQLVSVDEVKLEQCNLNVARYVNEKALFSNSAKTQMMEKEMDQLETELQDVRGKIKQKLSELPMEYLNAIDPDPTNASDEFRPYGTPLLAEANRLAYRLKKLLHEAGEDNSVTLSQHRMLDAIVEAHDQQKIGSMEYLQRILQLKTEVEASCYAELPASVRYGEDTRKLFWILSSMLLEADQDPAEANVEELVHRVVEMLQGSAIRDWESAKSYVNEIQGKLEDVLRNGHGQRRLSVSWDQLVERCMETGKVSDHS